MNPKMPTPINSNQSVEISVSKGNTYGLFAGVEGRLLSVGCSTFFS